MSNMVRLLKAVLFTIDFQDWPIVLKMDPVREACASNALILSSLKSVISF